MPLVSRHISDSEALEFAARGQSTESCWERVTVRVLSCRRTELNASDRRTESERACV